MPKQKSEKLRKYPSDLTEKQYKRIEKLLPKPKKIKGKAGRNPVEMFLVINAILYVLRSGCSWRMLPNDYPRWQTVYGYFNQFSKDAVWEKINAILVEKVRKRSKKGKKKHKKRKKKPSAGSIDSQSVKTTQIGGDDRGYDGGKKIKGRKRFILVDTIGLLLAVKVVSASITEKEGAQLLLTKIKMTTWLMNLCSKIEVIWADGGYQGEDLANWVTNLLNWAWTVVKRSDNIKGFVVIPRRWVVERTFAWFSFNRRLSKDYEKTTRNSESMIYLAMIQVIVKRLV